MTWWHYLLLVNIYLTLFYGFYALLLRRETFFQMNRIYLVGAALLSFFIPMIQSDWIQNLFITQEVQYTIYGTGPAVNIIALAPIKDTPYTLGQLMVMLYVAGVAVLALRLMWQFVLLRRVIKQVTPSVPYSFFNKINVEEDIEGKDVIMAHEQVHARQWHSADVLVIEAVMIINWFNPIVYLYRYAIKHIHEYIADRQALMAGTDKTEYALLLLSQTFNAPAHRLVNPFYNHSLLKQRIMMLQKSKSGRMKLLKYGLSAPMFILMLILSSATISNSRAVEVINKKAEWVMAKPATTIIPEEEQPIRSKSFNLEAAEEPGLVDATEGTLDISLPADTTRKKIFNKVDISPAFPGGEAGFATYINKTVRYTKEAKTKNIQGRTVLSFVVETDGSLSDIKVVRGLGYGLDEEAVRALQRSPKWKPGYNDGKKVRVKYALPVTFVNYNPSATAKVKIAAPLVIEDDHAIFTAVEQYPTFPGGDKALSTYISKQVKYPKVARENNVQGRVITSFLIEKDGSISDVKILRGIGSGADEEAARVVKAMPKWNPGKQNGRAVRTQYSIPINFALAADNTPTLKLQGKVSNQKVTPFNSKQNYSTDSTGRTPSAFYIKNGLSLEPLYIIDGKEVASIEYLQPNDIQSISVLKSKEALLNYGAKGLNGVILVTTKKVK